MDPRPRRKEAPRRANRGLGDVLHFFIPEEEQEEARRAQPEAAERRPGALEREVGTPASPLPEAPETAVVSSSARGVRWCVPASPGRTLACALAVDIAATLARGGCKGRVLAAFEPGPFLPEAASVSWETLHGLAQDPTDLDVRLAELPAAEHALVLVAPEVLTRVVGGLRRERLDGLLLPVDSAAHELARALGWLREFREKLPRLRMGVVLLGAADPNAADLLFRKLAGAARRQLGLELERLGELRRDGACDRSLLHGVSVVDVDAEGDAVKALAALCENLH